jgi:hypothetical protein
MQAVAATKLGAVHVHVSTIFSSSIARSRHPEQPEHLHAVADGVERAVPTDDATALSCPKTRTPAQSEGPKNMSDRPNVAFWYDDGA